MKKYLILGGVAALILVAVSVFALQGKDVQPAVSQQVAQEVAPKAASYTSMVEFSIRTVW